MKRVMGSPALTNVEVLEPAMHYVDGSERDVEQSEFTVLKLQQTLNKSFINMFYELNRINADSPSSVVLSNFFKFIQCFRYCLEGFPQIFIPCTSLSSTNQNDQFNTTTAFTEWLLMRLLKVLSQPYPAVVHDGCEDLFVSLLQVVRNSSPVCFRRFASCLLCVMSDLISFCKTATSGLGNNMLIEHCFLSGMNSSFKVEEGLDLSDSPIVISSLIESEHLQEKIIHLVQKLQSDLSLFLPDLYSNIWKMLCFSVENGNVSLKQASLQAIQNFVEKSGLPTSYSEISYILDCLQALVTYCCVNDSYLNRNSFHLENALASCLVSVSKAVEKNIHLDMFNCFALNRILENLIQIVVTCGLKKMRERNLHSAVMKAVVSFMISIRAHKMILPQNTMRLFHSTLCEYLGEKDSNEILIPIFVFLISNEISENNYVSSKISPLSSLLDKMRLPFYLKMNQLSVTWALVFDILLSMLKKQDSVPVEKAASHLCTVRTCLNVLLQSSVAFSLEHCSEPFIERTLGDSTSEVDGFHLPLDIVSLALNYAQKIWAQNFPLYAEILSLCKCLVIFQDFLPLTLKEYTNLASVLSLPWTPNMAADELEHLEIPFKSTEIGILNLPQEIKGECMEYLTLLPTNITQKWQSYVLQRCFISDDKEDRIVSIQILPMILYFKIFPEHVIEEILKQALHNKNIELLIEVARVVGKLNCILHSMCIVCRRKKTSENFTFFPEILCKNCDLGFSLDIAEDTCGSPWLIAYFTELLQHNDAVIRRECVLNVSSFLRHGKLNKNFLSSVLDLMIDSDAEVRKNFSLAAQYILKPHALKNDTCDWNAEIEEILINKLRNALHLAKCNNNVCLRESVLCTISELGKVADNGILLICIVSLLENLLSSLPTVVAIARLNMKEIAVSKQYKMSDLFKVYIEPVCKFLAESMLSFDADDVNNTLNILEKICSIFGYTDLKSFLAVTQQHLLPYIVRRETETTSSLIKLLSCLLGVNKRDLLMNNFPFIFSHLVCHCKKDELETALIYVQKETDLEFGSLLRCNYQHIHNELLLNISTHYEQVFAGLATLALKSEDPRKGDCVLTTREQMADYLQPKLLGFLVFFDSQLLKSSITLDAKKLALRSLICIMKLMGQRHITAVRFKVMATLRIALRFKDGDFPKICCQAWYTFVHSIEISSLGPLLNQVVVALLPLLELEPQDVSDILHFLIIKNQNSLKEYFHDLYFIPEAPEMQIVHSVLKEYTENPSSHSDFRCLLAHSLKGVSHENLEVRLHALAKMKQVLCMNQVSLHEHLLGRESVDHLLSYLITVVMPSCRESDMSIRIMLGECLGALGAIDPGRLEIKNITSKEDSDVFCGSVEEENFAFALIQKLAHSFLAAADCRVQDCSAFAIQEALRIYKCSEYKKSSSRDGSTNPLWKRFSPEIQEILEVLSHSQYKPLEKSRQVYPKPIYKSSMGSSFTDWVTNWFTFLLQYVKQDMATKVLNSCCMIIKYDLNCALFLLPHVVLYALIDSKEEAENQIVTEALAVLSDSEYLSLPSDLCQLSSQTVFSVIDHLVKWIRWKQKLIISENSKLTNLKVNGSYSLATVKSFLGKISQILLAKSSFCCHAYTRALMHLEQHLRDHPSDLESNISFLQKLYSSLDESDGVSGVAAIRTEEPTLKDAILEHEAIGDMQAAFACYEKAISIYPDEVSYYGGLLKCFIRMDQPDTALTYANGVLYNRPQWEDELNSYRVEAAWKLANWKSLHMFLENEPPSDKWNVGVGMILLCGNQENVDIFLQQIKNVRCSQMAPLSAASMENGAYLRGYEHLTRLHMLIDMEQSVKLLYSDDKSINISIVDSVLSEWKLRRHLVQTSLQYKEPILDMHRVLLSMCKEKHTALHAKFDEEIASCWLESAKLARKNGHQQRAYSCLLEASAVNSPSLFMEKAKWHWSKCEKEQAINCLKKGIDEHFGSGKTENKLKENSLCAKAKLLLAVYSEESAIADSNRLIQMYKEVVALQPQWEESHFHLAKYHDKVLSAMDQCENKMELMVSVAKGFALSLRYGCKHVYHSLPRLLDIWFDLGTQVVEQADKASKKTALIKSMEAALAQLTNIIIPDLWETLPLFLFMTAFPQLISRICHSHKDVFFQLQALIVKLLSTYSQQSIWMMIAVSKSSYPMRVQRCRKIFQAASGQKSDLFKFIQDTTKLADKLIELSNKAVTESNTFSIGQNFQILPKMLEDRNFSSIMLPLQSQMIVTLPSGLVSDSNHDPFPFRPICIQGFLDTVEVFPSLQRPKKLVITGSDGKLYGIICKPKDDLRKDCRLMEFNNLVNRYLKSDPESRKRQLYIRTYAVIPLNEECGLIEFVPNLSGLRHIITKIYKEKGIYVSGREIKAMMPHRTATAEQKLHIFKNKFLPKFPPVFSEWFLSMFPDPTAWYLARLAYARTTSVMSMVGYIVGLGDRHGENILFDSSCGDTVHVDLNCLFNKGETMECPECVPFRLTHNMVHAMGPTGFEGIFRKACEVTMRVMRSQTDALMSVLRPFVHDPLVEWSRSSRSARAQPPPSGEIRNEMGLIHVKDIEQRLNGIIKSKNKPQGLPLSIEGQVNYLIQEATDEVNLSQMYIGWTAYL